ncbi:type IV secretion protein Dot [Fluoribacter dumoffii]|uniref:type IV secretion protein Dot n=1 Tax=Fluoribacter dumoffii TaxID=463 RepID=UPI0022438118|nr:type IV secretion protein Dot [Fluoribacter dumoffii]MCW8387516.1 type IV secretion protein Dot [Fluoribacter dumoffii]MCW8497719.1 type IV secretion protein Dot [Fluoribacter dumoffii]
MRLKNIFFAAPKKHLLPPREWFSRQLVNSGLKDKFAPEMLEETQSSVKVFFNEKYFDDVSEVSESLVKVPAINVEGDREVYKQNGEQVANGSQFFSQIPEGHPEFLSPAKRLTGAKKIIASHSIILGCGGYPHNNPLILYKQPFKASIFSLAGATFENSYLHSKLFILDAKNPEINANAFSHLYKNIPTTVVDAKKELGGVDLNACMSRIRLGLSLLGRTSSGFYYPTFGHSNAVIFLTQAYFRHQLEDISLLLSAINETAKEAQKPAFLKATAVGMGFFAKIDGAYSIQHLLFPYYLRAYKQLIAQNSYPWIAKIEFPVFDEMQRNLFDGIFHSEESPIEISRSSRDVLNVTEEERENYFICMVNPSDAFAYAGNEWGYGSVEAMIGLNSSMRLDQVFHANPRLLDPRHYIGVSIAEDYRSELRIEKTVSSFNLR